MIFLGSETNQTSSNKHGNRKSQGGTRNSTKSSTHSNGLQKAREGQHKFRVKQRASKSEISGIQSMLSLDDCQIADDEEKESRSPFSVLSNLIEENAHLKQINEKNLIKHSIQEAEEQLLKVESSFGKRKSYMLTPNDIRSLCATANSEKDQSKEIVREYLEKRYGELPSVFESTVESDNSVLKTVNLPYSGSSFTRNIPDHSKIPAPPRKWLY